MDAKQLLMDGALTRCFVRDRMDGLRDAMRGSYSGKITSINCSEVIRG